MGAFRPLINLVLFVVLLLKLCVADGYQDEEYTLAYLNVSYQDPVSKKIHWDKEAVVGKYGQGKVGAVEGVLVHVRSRVTVMSRAGTNVTQVYENNGCEANFDDENIPKGGGEQWIGLIKKGQCSIAEKILNAAGNNATAVIIYDDEQGPIQKMHHRVPNVVSVMISRDKGERLAKLADSMSNGTLWVRVSIMVGAHQTVRMANINRTSVLFVSVSFIVLMVISLAWLIFYYIQRFRYINVKDQLAKRLSTAAKKALTKIPLKTVKEVDGDGECCAVCLERYRVHDLLRILPCSHQFHRMCVDQWLLDQRTCPMCKLDILKYFGLVCGGGEYRVEVETSGSSLSHSPASRRAASAANSAISAPSAAARLSEQFPATPASVEAIKIAILENSPMASRNLRRAEDTDNNYQLN